MADHIQEAAEVLRSSLVRVDHNQLAVRSQEAARSQAVENQVGRTLHVFQPPGLRKGLQDAHPLLNVAEGLQTAQGTLGTLGTRWFLEEQVGSPLTQTLGAVDTLFHMGTPLPRVDSSHTNGSNRAQKMDHGSKVGLMDKRVGRQHASRTLPLGLAFCRNDQMAGRHLSEPRMVVKSGNHGGR